MTAGAVLAALSDELADFAGRLTRLQQVPFLGDASGAPLAGAALMQAMIALQDLDRLAQDAAALSAFAMDVANSSDEFLAVEHALADMRLRSLADRLAARIG